MCGIVGAVAQRDVDLILMEGLRRLEYRGYDSAGVAIVAGSGELNRRRAVGKVKALSDMLDAAPLSGSTGLAHTRWATHGAPTEANAHPHFSSDRVALVHNGIIENFAELRDQLIEEGYAMASETDTEVMAHLIHKCLEDGKSLLDAVRQSISLLRGAYAIAVVDRENPDRMVGARSGSPLVLGIGLGENFLASDASALLPVTQRFVYLDEGDLAEITRRGWTIYDAAGEQVDRAVKTSRLSSEAAERGEYRHYMQKEIHEQPDAIAQTLEGRTSETSVLEAGFGTEATEMLAKAQAVHIIACGTSFHAGLVARYWIESMAKMPCTVEIASEYRYRKPAVPENTLFLTISQSGETADTLAALRESKNLGYLASMCICNVPESSLVRESDLVLMTRAGPEIGVASTKAFTTQLAALMLITIVLARQHGLDEVSEAKLVSELRSLPQQIREVLALDEAIAEVSEDFIDKHHALFLGRGAEYPIAMEGALKLKEISYIHAEAYAAGELKHGPLALVDEDLPVITSASSNDLLEKLVSNLQEVRARGGQLYVFADREVSMEESEGVRVISLPSSNGPLAPIIHTVPLQLLAYHTAVLKGTDVDQPRNLAKSVTVE